MSDDAVLARLDCPKCGKRLKIPESAAGRRISCPRCGHAIVSSQQDSPSKESASIVTANAEEDGDDHGLRWVFMLVSLAVMAGGVLMAIMRPTRVVPWVVLTTGLAGAIASNPSLAGRWIGMILESWRSYREWCLASLCEQLNRQEQQLRAWTDEFNRLRNKQGGYSEREILDGMTLIKNTKRPRNYCISCGYSWFPRGAHLSAACPECSASNVTFSPEYGDAGRGAALRSIKSQCQQAESAIAWTNSLISLRQIVEPLLAGAVIGGIVLLSWNVPREMKAPLEPAIAANTERDGGRDRSSAEDNSGVASKIVGQKHGNDGVESQPPTPLPTNEVVQQSNENTIDTSADSNPGSFARLLPRTSVNTTSRTTAPTSARTSADSGFGYIPQSSYQPPPAPIVQTNPGSPTPGSTIGYTSGGSAIHVGPRGGQYVITSSGKKRYLSSSKKR